MKMLIFTILHYVLIAAINAQSITYIDLTKAKFGDIPANRIFEEIEIVPLETHPDALLNVDHPNYYLTDKYIIAMTSIRKVFSVGVAYLFDRKTGSFIRQVSAIGQGPDEYLFSPYNEYGFDENNSILYVTDNLMGELCKGINIDTNKTALIVKKTS